jgi:uncharacterized membrane protein YozB (DUF420 family)
MSVSDNHIFVIATISLVLQFVILFILSYAFWLERKRKHRLHAVFMTGALVLHLSTIFVIMVPSFILAILPYFIIRYPFAVGSLVSLVHVPLGLLAVSLGTWIILSWKLKGFSSCFSRKKIMLTTMIVWIASLLFGIALYIILNWSVFAG